MQHMPLNKTTISRNPLMPYKIHEAEAMAVNGPQTVRAEPVLML